jgi:predicted ATPase
MALAAAEGFALRLEQGRICRGWALVMQGDAAAGVAHIRQGLAASQGVGPELLRPYWLAFLAEAYSQAGQPEAGLQVLDEALTLVASMEARSWEAELYRLQGVLQLQLPSPDVSQAELCFQQALAVARSQQAKSLELRAALSLTRLWQQQGKQDEARELLTSYSGSCDDPVLGINPTSRTVSIIVGYCWRTPKSRNFHPVFSFFAHREFEKLRAEVPSLED